MGNLWRVFNKYITYGSNTHLLNLLNKEYKIIKPKIWKYWLVGLELQYMCCGAMQISKGIVPNSGDIERLVGSLSLFY